MNVFHGVCVRVTRFLLFMARSGSNVVVRVVCTLPETAAGETRMHSPKQRSRAHQVRTGLFSGPSISILARSRRCPRRCPGTGCTLRQPCRVCVCGCVFFPHLATALPRARSIKKQLMHCSDLSPYVCYGHRPRALAGGQFLTGLPV